MNDTPAVAIDLKDIDFSWPGHGSKSVGGEATKPVLFQSLNFSAERGEKVFLHGPSGSGKSTLLSLICGTIEPDRGQVNIIGENLADKTWRQRDRFRAECIGIIFQQFNLVPYLTALENVLVPMSFALVRRERAGGKVANTKQTATALLDRVGLSAAQLSNRSVSELSVGQQQRVAAARALIGKPEIIIADEPTSSLDSDKRSDFMALLFEEVERNGSSLVFVSHDMSLQSGFDQTIALSDLGTSNGLGDEK
ncbi:MAG: ABC transporter ATP-binding protein [Pseudomonadota bacterium]